MEMDFRKNNSYNLFKSVMELTGRPRKSIVMINDKQGNKQTNINKVLKCWEEHFEEHLNNKKLPYENNALHELEQIEENVFDTEQISEEEIKKSVSTM